MENILVAGAACSITVSHMLRVCLTRRAVCIFGAGIPGQALAVPAVFDSLDRAAADIGHAVGAILTPNGHFVI